MSDSPVSALRCPSCGAPAASGAARCDYCHTRLATVSCPSCFAGVMGGAAFCSACGTAQARAEAASTIPIRCPACPGHMRWIQVGDTDLLECSECDGTWLEGSAFEHLCAHRESQAAVLHGQVVTPDEATNPTTAPRVQYRPCPRCGKLMNRMNFGRHSGAVVDVCRGHGTFLDRGELHQVVRFIQQGGLDRAREAEREELREERRRLQAVERNVVHLAPVASSRFAWDERWVRDSLQALVEPK